jgi:hypothetical protein
LVETQQGELKLLVWNELMLPPNDSAKNLPAQRSKAALLSA